MKLLAFLSVLLFSFNVLGASKYYKMKIETDYYGQKMQIPELIVEEGKKVEFFFENDYEEKSFIEIELTALDKKQVSLQAFIGDIDDNGERVIKSSPRIVTLHGYEASIESGNSIGDKTGIKMTPEPLGL